MPAPVLKQKDHICCCNPDRALCGQFVGGQPLQLGGSPKNPCQQCWNMYNDGTKCPDPECPGDDLGDL